MASPTVQCSGATTVSRCIRRPADSSGKASACSTATRSTSSSASRIMSCCRLVQVLQDVDDIVGVQLAHRLGDSGARQGVDHLFADAFVQFRQHLAVDQRRPQRQQRPALRWADLFQQVGDVGGVQLAQQRPPACPRPAPRQRPGSARRGVRPDRLRRRWSRCLPSVAPPPANPIQSSFNKTGGSPKFTAPSTSCSVKVQFSGGSHGRSTSGASAVLFRRPVSRRTRRRPASTTVPS